MSSKINFRNIVAAHLATLKNFDSGRYRPADFILFFILPAAAAAAALFFGANPGDGLQTSLILFAGLNGVAMVSALTLLLKLANDEHANACHQTADAPVRRRLIIETHANVSYSLLVSFLLATAAVFRAVVEHRAGEAAPSPLRQAATFVCLYLAANLSLSLLMVLRRLTVLLTRQLEAE
jgi:hypothetical protein